jgi:hypothetical protein
MANLNVKWSSWKIGDVVKWEEVFGYYSRVEGSAAPATITSALTSFNAAVTNENGNLPIGLVVAVGPPSSTTRRRAITFPASTGSLPTGATWGILLQEISPNMLNNNDGTAKTEVRFPVLWRTAIVNYLRLIFSDGLTMDFDDMVAAMAPTGITVEQGV